MRKITTMPRSRRYEEALPPMGTYIEMDCTDELVSRVIPSQYIPLSVRKYFKFQDSADPDWGGPRIQIGRIRYVEAKP